MKKLLATTAVMLALLVSHASAQFSPDPVQLYMIQLLGAPDARLRARAMREVEASAGTLTPLTLYAVPMQLAQAHEDEAALTWLYFAELRLRTDIELNPTFLAAAGPFTPDMLTDGWGRQVSARMNHRERAISPERRRALLNQAVRLEQRTARSYAADWVSHLTGVNDSPSTARWPQSAEIARARTRALEALRSRLEASFRMEALEHQTASAIAAHTIPPEANELIPAEFRQRIVATHALDLEMQCGDIDSIIATPWRAPHAGFVVNCRAPEDGAKRSIWVDGEGRVIGSTGSPQQTYERGGAMAMRNGMSYLVYGQNQDIVLLGVDGRIEQIVPPPVEGTSLRNFTSVTRSGRYAVFNLGEATGILDLSANRWTWTQNRTPSTASQQTVQTAFSYVNEDDNGALYMVSVRRTGCQGIQPCANAELVVRDVASGRERSLTIANLLMAEPRGPTQAMISLARNPSATPNRESAVHSYANEEEWSTAIEAARNANTGANTQRAVIVDLNSMQVTWSGARDAAPGAPGVRCVLAPDLTFALRAPSPSPQSRIEIGAENHAMVKPTRANADACAVSADASAMAISARPFVYLYAIRQPQ